MMDTIRLTLALVLFSLGLYLIFDLFVSGFNLFILGAAIGCFVLARYVKPKTYHEDDADTLSEIIDLIIELPFRLIARALRVFARGLKDNVDEIDL